MEINKVSLIKVSTNEKKELKMKEGGFFSGIKQLY